MVRKKKAQAKPDPGLGDRSCVLATIVVLSACPNLSFKSVGKSSPVSRLVCLSACVPACQRICFVCRTEGQCIHTGVAFLPPLSAHLSALLLVRRRPTHRPPSLVSLSYPCVPEKQQPLPAASSTVRPNSSPAMLANMTRTQKYMVPVAGMKAVKVAEEEEEELTREEVELVILEFRRKKKQKEK